jgi:hypothetical protein
MSRQRFKEQEADYFFGHLVHNRIVPENRFSTRLNGVMYRGSDSLRNWRGTIRAEPGVGRPPYDPAVLLDMLRVAYLYDLSERQVEEVARFANINLTSKFFRQSDLGRIRSATHMVQQLTD